MKISSSFNNVLYINALLFLLLGTVFCNAQNLKPGFDPNEYSELLRVTARQRGPISDTLYPPPLRYDLAYNSPSMGLDNGWQLWVSKDSIVPKNAVISIRATTSAHSSWIENLFSTMVPAKGSIELEPTFTWDYRLADHPQATVHVGWLIGTAYLERDILPKIDSCYQAGIKDFIIFGHSQGGAISYFMTADVHYKQLEGKLPKDITFKTYGSAGPKPGNLFFAYDYENYTQRGWAYNVVNTEDWVPEMPLSLQSDKDFSESNPLKYFKEGTKDLSLLKKAVVRGKYNSIIKKIRKTDEKYNKVMGEDLSKFVQKYIKEFETDFDFEKLDYQRCGNYITLYAGPEYFKYFKKDNPDVFRNHMMDAYQILLEMHYSDELLPEYVIYTNHKFPFYKNPEILQLHADE